MNDDKKKTFGDRDTRQKDEHYDTVPTDLPPARFQDSKQVLTPDELGGKESKVTAPSGDQPADINAATLKAAKSIKSKVHVAPDATVEVLDGKQVGGVPLQNTAVVSSVAGFSTVSTASDMSKTSYSSGNYRPNTRYGKKRSEDLFEIDNTISEQIAPVVEDSKDLRESPDSLQGYNGRKQFTQSRQKKNVAGLPQELLQEASVDFVYDDAVIATSGQILDNIESQANYPTQGGTPSSAIATPMKKDNYMPTSLNLTISDGHISAISVSENVYHSHAAPAVQDEANMNWQVDANNVAKSMIKLQTTLGRETTDKWSPLGYVVNQPYEYNMLEHDIEATTGAVMATAYRAAVSSLSFQRNILAKDGISPQASAIKMFLEDYGGELSNSKLVPNGNFSAWLFNQHEYQQGSAAAMIAMFDSVQKYRTKGDILGMQRSLSLHLSQCDNNLNPLHVKRQFMAVLDKAHLFSTPDGSYNPLLPIFATRKIDLILPLSLNYFLLDWKNPTDFDSDDLANPLRDQRTGTLSQYWYQYKDIRNTYTTRVQMPLVEGLLQWMLKHEGSIVRTYGEGTFNIPFRFDFTNPGMLEFMLCSASQDILWQRNICFRDVLFAGEQETYIWDDLISLKDADPLHSSQMTIKGYNESLKLGKMDPDVKLRTFWNDSMTLLDVDGTIAAGANYLYSLPWYYNEHTISDAPTPYTANESYFNEQNLFNMTIPSIRDGVRHDYVDIIKSLDERDIRLALDRYVDIPLFETALSGYDYVTNKYSNASQVSSTVNSHIKMGALRYEYNSDGRVVEQINAGGASGRVFSENALYCIPKEIGFIWSGREQAVKVIRSMTATTGDGVSITYYTRDSSTDVYDGSRSTRLCSYRVSADSMSNGSIDRSAALTQVYYQCFALRDVTAANVAYTNATGLAPSQSYNGGDAEAPTCIFAINSIAPASFAMTTLSTNARVNWTKLQRFVMPINPFENAYIVSTSGAIDGVKYDPLETAFDFGVCGTLASDFSQDVLERLDERDQLGIDYTEDKFAHDSLIFRV